MKCKAIKGDGNKIVILRNNNQFEVHDDPCVDNPFEPDKASFLKKFKEFKDAVKFAKEYCEEEIVEYGIYFDDSCWEARE